MTNTRLQRSSLYLLLTRELCAADPLETLRASIRGGVDVVQIREKPLDGSHAAWVETVAACCRELDVTCIVNDSLELAPRADGLHLGQEDLAPFRPGHFRVRDGLLGISTHDPQELARALVEEPDYIGIGPCFATETKGYAQGRTDEELRELVALAGDLPVFAIGGITAERLPRLRACGVTRIAVSSAILGAQDPEAESRRLKKGLAGFA